MRVVSWGMIVNWNIDEEKYKLATPNSYKIWRMKQTLSFGGGRVSKSSLIKNWEEIKGDLDIDTVKALEFLVWGKKWKTELGLRPDRKNFWNWYLAKNISAINSI